LIPLYFHDISRFRDSTRPMYGPVGPRGVKTKYSLICRPRLSVLLWIQENDRKPLQLASLACKRRRGPDIQSPPSCYLIGLAWNNGPLITLMPFAFGPPAIIHLYLCGDTYVDRRHRRDSDWCCSAGRSRSGPGQCVKIALSPTKPRYVTLSSLRRLVMHRVTETLLGMRMG
jgi:hypothetical protein